MKEPACQVVADIGGTNSRFACVAEGATQLEFLATLPSQAHAGMAAVVQAYLATLPKRRIRALCLAVAAPVTEDQVQLTNLPWRFSVGELARTLDCEVKVINDFAAQAAAIDTLALEELEWFSDRRPSGHHMRVVLGPGTGLGVAGLWPTGEVLPTEGGHVGFAPTNPHELALLQTLWRRFPRVSVERLLSGPGLANLYWANSVLAGEEDEKEAENITQGALHGDTLCLRSVDDFLDILATTAGDTALLFWALDGVYLSGGILPRLGKLLDRQRFLQRFSAKGRYRTHCEAMPVALVKAEHTGLRGCLQVLRKGI